MGSGMNRQKLKNITERAANSDFIHLTGTLHISNDLQNSKTYLTLKYVMIQQMCSRYIYYHFCTLTIFRVHMRHVFQIYFVADLFSIETALSQSVQVSQL